MWEWILSELRKVVKALPLNDCIVGIEKDDIVSLVTVSLCQNPDMAKRIYENKEIGLLYTLAKKEIYNQRGKMFFENKQEFSRFQRIMAVCEKYDIEPVPSNAYKISAILENGFANFTISGVITLLSQDCPIQYGYQKREENAYFHEELSVKSINNFNQEEHGEALNEAEI